MSLPPTCLWPWESHFLSLKIHYYSCLLLPHIHLLPLQVLTTQRLQLSPRNFLHVFPQPSSDTGDTLCHTERTVPPWKDCVVVPSRAQKSKSGPQREETLLLTSHKDPPFCP